MISVFARIRTIGVIALVVCATACDEEKPLAEKQTAAKKQAAAVRAELVARNLPAASDPVAAWRQFRAVYPYHVQVLALSEAASDGSRSLIVSEPSPHVTEADVLAPLAQVLRGHSVQRQRIGYDGWVHDLAISVAGKEPQLTQALSALYRRLFFTTYKAYILRLPAQEVQWHLDLDLNVTANELNEWVIAGHDTYSGVERDGEITIENLATTRSCGVYPSTHGGLVGWWVPAGVEVDTCRVSIRQFALDSDLIVGAIGMTGGTLILGRERIVPVELLPPLRFETITLLASSARSGPGELEQSYERFAPFAGRIDAKYDWAPILLSPELRDTEYGSLLNITDQLLKGWSNAGTTHYVNFDYRAPKGYPFDRPLARHLGVNRVVYNWNTAGAAYSVNLGDAKVIALNRTGALPVSYIPEGTSAEQPSSRVTAAEDRAYAYFAGLSDPNLVRVVQYAALYQFFANLGVSNRPTVAAGGEYAQKRLEEVTNQLSAGIAGVGDDQLRRLARVVAPVLTASLNYDPASAEAVALKTLQSFREGRGNPKDLLARTVLSVVAGQQKLHINYARDVSARTRGWIHTPAVVLSWNDKEPNVMWVGGHNVGARVTDVKTSERIRPGSIDIENGDLVVNPKDAARVGRVIRTAGRYERASLETRRRQIEGAFASAPADVVRPRVAALRLPPANGPEGARLSWTGNWAKRIGWIPSEATAARQPRNVAQIAVFFRDGQYILQNGSTTAFHADTVDAAAEAFVRMMGNERLRGNGLAVELHGLEKPEAVGFMHTCEIRARSSGSRRVMSAQVDDGRLTEETLRSLRSLGLDLSKATIEAKDVTATGTALKTGFTVEIPTADRASAVLDVELEFDKSVGETGVRVVMTRIMAWLRAFLAEPRSTMDLWLLNHRVNQAIKQISLEQKVGLHRVGQKFTHGQHDVHFTNLRHEQPDSTATGRPA